MDTTPLKFIRLTGVCEMTGYCRSSIYAHVAEGNFPKPVHLAGRAVAWVESEVQQWMRQRLQAARGLDALGGGE